MVIKTRLKSHHPRYLLIDTFLFREGMSSGLIESVLSIKWRLKVQEVSTIYIVYSLYQNFKNTEMTFKFANLMSDVTLAYLIVPFLLCFFFYFNCYCFLKSKQRKTIYLSCRGRGITEFAKLSTNSKFACFDYAVMSLRKV